MSLTSSSASTSDKLAALVLALIELVLGLKDSDDDDKKLLAGLVGLLALSGGRQTTSEFTSIELRQSSQVAQVVTTTNTAAVQAGSYGRLVSGTEGGGSAVGGNLNVTG
jgi:hypothetical protein